MHNPVHADLVAVSAANQYSVKPRPLAGDAELMAAITENWQASR